MAGNIHGAGPVFQAGTLNGARAVCIMLHGRGASADSVLQLVSLLGGDLAGLAPQAAGYAWYPHRFIRPIETNEPYLSDAIALVHALIAHVGEQGIPQSRVILGGFSQGACLALEAAARHGGRFGAVFGFSGGLIGPLETVRAYGGDLAGTPVLLACSEHDEHIPREYVEATERELREHGAAVEMRWYADNAHTITDDALEAARRIAAGVGL